MTDLDTMAVLDTICECLRLWRERPRPADRRELARQLAHAYGRLADHYRGLADPDDFVPDPRD